MTKIFKLTKTDELSATWQKLEKYFKDRLDLLRRDNDKQKDEIQTAYLRGRILEVKSLLALTKNEQPNL